MNNKRKKTGKSITDQVCDLDSQILKLLAKRADLLKKSAQARNEKHISIVDSEQEKKIWKSWYRSIEGLELNPQLLKKIFNCSNALAYHKTEEKKEEQFELKPDKRKAQVDVIGPKDRDMTRFWMTMAAQNASYLEISPAVLNDPIVELAKALNMADCNFSWDKSGIIKESGAELDFDEKLIFVGEDMLNLYILVCLSLQQVGNCKFTGSSILKVQNLGDLYQVLPNMGARAVPLIAGNSGLPIRIEQSAQLNTEIEFFQDTSEDLIAVLALYLPLMCKDKEYQEILLQKPAKFRSYKRLERVAEILQCCGMRVNFSENRFQIQNPEDLSLTQAPEIPLDPVLSAYLLALPGIIGGTVELQGKFPKWNFDAKLVENILNNSGINLQILPEKVSAKESSNYNSQVNLDIADYMELYPLCIALGVALPVPVFLKMPQMDEFGLILLEKLNVFYRLNSGILEISNLPQEAAEKVHITVPDAWWGMGVALISLVRSGVLLENPGELTKLWPSFWSIFKGLPDPQVIKERAQESERTSSQRRKLRRKVE